jgi:hypothetical protein
MCWTPFGVRGLIVANGQAKKEADEEAKEDEDCAEFNRLGQGHGLFSLWD